MNTTEIILLAVGVPVLGVAAYLIANKQRVANTVPIVQSLPQAYGTAKGIKNDSKYMGDYMSNLSKSNEYNDDYDPTKRLFRSNMTAGRRRKRVKRHTKKHRK